MALARDIPELMRVIPNLAVMMPDWSRQVSQNADKMKSLPAAKEKLSHNMVEMADMVQATATRNIS